MKPHRLVIPLLLVCVQAGSPTSAGNGEETAAHSTKDHATKGLPTKVENFRLLDQTGRSVELYRAVEAAAVVLYIHGVGCPMVRQIIPELTRIQQLYQPKGVKFFMLNANSQDTRDDLLKDAKKFDIDLPILKDDTQHIVQALGCRRTAEVLVVDPGLDWKIIYRGPVDDRFNYGAQKAKAAHPWLRDALEAHLAGKPVAIERIPPKGCLIRYLHKKKASYPHDVAPILLARCVPCHREGGVGPFAMSSYRQVAGWAAMIQETIRTRRMPPWHADREYGIFHNSIGLSVEEERILLAWLEQEAADDRSGIDPLKEYEPPKQDTWQFGPPDKIVQLPRVQSIPAEGVIDYRYLSVPSGLTEDRWVRAVDVLPTSLSVVHHALIFVIYPHPYRHLQPDAKNGLNGFFASFLPGGNGQPLPKETGCFVPAGSTFIFQMHYTTTGVAENDQTRMGLYFHAQPPKQVLTIQATANLDFEIPPQVMDWPAEADYRFRQDAQLLGLSPHMHYRGSRFRFDASFPDGRKQTLLSVPFYEFDWQPMYLFDKRIPVPKGTQLHCVGAFDNSKFNPRNPDPDISVRFGEQSFEEMFIGYVAFSVPYREEDYLPRDVNPDLWAGYGKPMTRETLTGTTWRLGRRLRFHFAEGGTLKINGKYPGTWNLDGNTVHLEAGPRKVDLNIQLDELVLKGRPLRRILQGE